MSKNDRSSESCTDLQKPTEDNEGLIMSLPKESRETGQERRKERSKHKERRKRDEHNNW